MKVLKIFLSGITPYADNRGVAAIFRGTLEFLERAFSNYRLKVYVWHTYPESLQRHHKGVITSKFASKNIDVEVIPHVSTSCRSTYICLGSYVLKLLLMLLITTFLSVLHLPKKFQKIDVLHKIFISDFVVELSFGDFFTDTYYGNLGGFLNLMRILLLTLSGKPLYMFPQSIGPFKHSLNKALSRFILNKTKLICIREPNSMENILSMGVDRAKIKFIPDMAFLLHPISLTEAQEILEREGLTSKHSKKSIGVTLNLLTIASMKKPERIMFLHKLAIALDRLSEEHNASIVFIPHVTIIIPNQCDCRRLSISVQGMLRNKVHSVVLTKEYSVEELWGVIGLCNVVISMLTHPVIAALKAGVPVVAISYSHKTLGIMKLFNMERYVVDYHDFDDNSLNRMVNDLLKDYDDIRQKLLTRAHAIIENLHNFQDSFFQRYSVHDKKYSC